MKTTRKAGRLEPGNLISVDGEPARVLSTSIAAAPPGEVRVRARRLGETGSLFLHFRLGDPVEITPERTESR